MKKSVLLFMLLLAVSLSACSVPPTPAPEPAASPAPTNTPVPPATETPTPIPPTSTPEPSPTPDPLLFRDEFDGSLGEGWQWLREKPQAWSLTNNPGWLEIIARPGYVSEGNLDNQFMRPIPEGNFELETKIKFKPVGDFQIAGLLNYESPANFIQFGRAFCDYPQCANDGFYMDVISGGNMLPENFAVAAPATDTVYLRLRREGDTYSSYASEDGQEWKMIGTQNSPMNPLFIGLVAGQAWSAPQAAQFDYFVVYALP